MTKHRKSWKDTVSRVFVMALLAGAWPSLGQSDDPGAYLQGRFALNHFEFEQAARQLTRAYAAGNKSLSLIDSVMLSHVAAGDLKAAQPYLRVRDGAQDGYGEIGSIVALAMAAQSDDPQTLLTTINERGVEGPLLRTLLTAWAHFMASDPKAALAQLSGGDTGPGAGAIVSYFNALILGLSGDRAAAIEFLKSPQGNSALVLSEATQLFITYLIAEGQLDQARAEFAKIPVNSDPTYVEMQRAVEAGDASTLYLPSSAREGAAEVFYLISSTLGNDVDPLFRLVYSRAAQYIAPSHVPAQILSAGLLADLEQYDQAVANYPRLERESPYFLYAQLGVVDAQLAQDEFAQAVETLIDLTQAYPNLPMVWARLGDAYRYQDMFADAEGAYGQAIELLADGSPNRWLYLFSRGIVRERLGDWPNSESDLRAALDLQPDNASILNYLGYSMLELSDQYDEALQFIQRAVEIEPRSGHILDSLAWGYYRLGRYAEAVAPMERAAQLMPFDPIINDHLGDIYYRVGRVREAMVQWQRALSLDPEPKEAELIREKIATGGLSSDG